MKLSKVLSFPTLNTPYKAVDFNLHNLDKFQEPITGIEVEVENVDKDSTKEHLNDAWTMIEDGSLRNHGAEFVSKPIYPANIESALSYLYTKTLHSSVHFSPRTSVHAHLNCRDITFLQIYNIVILYQCFESLLYSFAGNERKKSIFCVPLSNTMYYLQLKANLSTNLIPQWSKYTGLNLTRLSDLGTIEFRHLRGTSDYHLICNWLEILYKLYNFAINIKTNDLEKLIIDTRKDRSYVALLLKVFDDISHKLPINNTWEKDMELDCSVSKLYMTPFKAERTK
jgi:hypothetical protein